jgi:hypothetical protein
MPKSCAAVFPRPFDDDRAPQSSHGPSTTIVRLCDALYGDISHNGTGVTDGRRGSGCCAVNEAEVLQPGQLQIDRKHGRFLNRVSACNITQYCIFNFNSSP